MRRRTVELMLLCRAFGMPEEAFETIHHHHAHTKIKYEKHLRYAAEVGDFNSVTNVDVEKRLEHMWREYLGRYCLQIGSGEYPKDTDFWLLLAKNSVALYPMKEPIAF